MTIRVNAELFRLAYVAVSSEETRYYLNGVHVEPHPKKGVLLVSTDGHRMVCIHDENGECDSPAIIKLPKFALALCATKKGKGLGVDRCVIEVNTEDKKATILIERVGRDGIVSKTNPLITAHDVVIEGTFPDWRKVTPKGPFEPVGVAGFNSKYLSELAAFGSRFASSAHRNVGMYFLRRKDGNDLEPVMIRWGTIGHIFAVLMPMRTEPDMNLPSFLTTEPTEALTADSLAA